MVLVQPTNGSTDLSVEVDDAPSWKIISKIYNIVLIVNDLLDPSLDVHNCVGSVQDLFGAIKLCDFR